MDITPRMTIMLIFGVACLLFLIVGLFLVLSKKAKAKNSEDDWETDFDEDAEGQVDVVPPFGSPFGGDTAQASPMPPMQAPQQDIGGLPQGDLGNPFAAPNPAFQSTVTMPSSNIKDEIFQLLQKVCDSIGKGNVSQLSELEAEDLATKHAELINEYRTSGITRTMSLTSIGNLEELEVNQQNDWTFSKYRVAANIKDYIQDAVSLEIIGGDVDSIYPKVYIVETAFCATTGVMGLVSVALAQ